MPITACIAMIKVGYGKYGTVAVRISYILRINIKKQVARVYRTPGKGKGGPVIYLGLNWKPM
jgi:hypothetical protein